MNLPKNLELNPKVNETKFYTFEEFEGIVEDTEDGIFVIGGFFSSRKAYFGNLENNQEEYEEFCRNVLFGFNTNHNLTAKDVVLVLHEYQDRNQERTATFAFVKLDKNSGFEDRDRFNEAYYEKLTSGLKLSDSLKYYQNSSMIDKLREKGSIRCLVLGASLSENYDALIKFFQNNQISA